MSKNVMANLWAAILDYENYTNAENFEALNEAYDKANTEFCSLSDASERTEWIPIENGLPKDGRYEVTMVLFDNTLIVDTLNFENDVWRYPNDSEAIERITAYRPLPKPYKETE